MKKVLRLVILLFIIFLVFSISNAYNIDEYKTSITLGYDSNKIRTTMNISTNESEISRITIPISFYPENLFIYDSAKRLDYDIIEDEEDFIIVIHKNIEPEQNEKINMKFEYTKIRKIENIYIFGYSIETPEVNNFEVLIKLPVGAVISDTTETESIFPKPDVIGSDGQRIILRWEKENTEDEEFRIFILFEPIHEETLTSFGFYPIFIIILSATIILGIYLFFQKRESKIKTIGLDKNEKKVYNFIKSKKEIKQKSIQKELDFSKPRLSKLLRSLEEKKLIEKKPSGRTNIIKIKK